MDTLNANKSPKGFKYKSYHDLIQKVAQAIAKERNKVYNGGARSDNPKCKKLVFNEFQMQMFYGAIYKLYRAKNNQVTIKKCLDDLVDAYNCIALLYQDLTTEAD